MERIRKSVDMKFSCLKFYLYECFFFILLFSNYFYIIIIIIITTFSIVTDTPKMKTYDVRSPLVEKP